MPLQIYFTIKINIPELEDIYSNSYQAELIINDNNITETVLKIYFKESENLDDKIQNWVHHNDFSLLNRIDVLAINSPANVISVSFAGYDFNRLKKCDSFYENNLYFFILKMNGVKIAYKTIEEQTSEFFLNQQSFNLVESNYTYSSYPLNKEDPYRLQPKNSFNEFVQFNKIAFKLEHNFFNSTPHDSTEITICKEPRLLVKYCDISEKEIKEHVAILCILYSFYCQCNIDWHFSKVWEKGKFYDEIRIIEDGSIKTLNGIFRWKFANNPLNLIQNIDVQHLLRNLDFVNKTVARYNFALKTTGESQFMILYNILEQIRNEYILHGEIEQEKAGNPPNLKKVIEKYKFSISGIKMESEIRKTLENLIQFIDDEHKELFREEIQYKLTPIMVFSMKNQFQSLFDHLEINPREFGLKFDELKKLRDSIFHGRPVGEHRELLEEATKVDKLPSFVGSILLKYFGYKDNLRMGKVG